MKQQQRLKPSSIGYHFLHKDDEVKVNIKPLQEKVAKSLLDYMKEIVEKSREAYEKDTEKGTFLKVLYKLTEQQDPEILKYIHNRIEKEEPTIAIKSDFAQMIILTKIIIDLHFEILNLLGNDYGKIKRLIDVISLLRFDLKPEAWLAAYEKHVLPVLSEMFTTTKTNLNKNK